MLLNSIKPLIFIVNGRSITFFIVQSFFYTVNKINKYIKIKTDENKLILM